jgi:hypothetical protein
MSIVVLILISMLGFPLENLQKVFLFSIFSTLLLVFQSAADMVLAEDNFATIVAVCQSLFILFINITIFFSIFVFFLCIYFFFATIVAVCQSLFILSINITIFFSIFVFFLCVYFFSWYAFILTNSLINQ